MTAIATGMKWLGRAVLDGLAAAGVVGVVKHMPGHGRTLVDSHLEMPVVEADAEALEVDLEPFRSLASAPMGMTAHLLYRAWPSNLTNCSRRGAGPSQSCPRRTHGGC